MTLFPADPTTPTIAAAPTPALPTPALRPSDLQRDYHLGRELSRALCNLLPHATVGRVCYVRRSDIERVFERAIQDGADLWDIVRDHDRGELLLWLRRAA